MLIVTIIASVGAFPALANSEDFEATNVSSELNLANLMESEYADELVQAYETYSVEAYNQGKYVTMPLEIFMYNYNPTVFRSIENYTNIMMNDLNDCQTIESVMEISEEMRVAAEAKAQDTATPYASQGKWYYNCPELAKNNAYGVYDLLGSSVTSGDIVMDEDGLFGLTGHTGIVVGHFYSSIFQSYYVRVVEAVIDGVCYGILCDERVEQRDSYVYRVNTTTTKRIAAVEWACDQLGKPYLIVSGSNVNAQRANWYCSLLCYASYAAQSLYLVSYSDYQILPPRTLINSSYLTMMDIGR